MPLALVITAPGINCDLELAHAFEMAGAEVESVLLKRLAAEPELIERFDLIGLPGGFSFGDDIAAGRIMATLVRQSLYPKLVDAVERGVPIIAPCNGFQIAVQAGLLPGPEGRSARGQWPREAASATVALADNASARFSDRWVKVQVPAETCCIWTRGLHEAGGMSMLPIAHGEGRFVAAPATLSHLERDGRIAIRYAADDNPNGSVSDVAGICDATGLVFGLMPHPERFTRWTQHPWWTRLEERTTDGEPLGLRIFRNAVEHVLAVPASR
jgi:phosphoribosylformylglycinamidine synthase subunit PurQ / glutaminase